jgi:hypothetical protein
MYYGANQIVILIFSGDEFHYDDPSQFIKAHFLVPEGFQDGKFLQFMNRHH